MDQEKLSPPDQSAAEYKSHNASPSQKTAIPRWRFRGKEKSSIQLLCTWIVEHQIGKALQSPTETCLIISGISVSLLSALFLAHSSYPNARHHTRKFFQISYYNPKTGNFALGWDDIFFVFYWIVVFTGMRCAVMDYILTPAASWAGIRKKKVRTRFAEQAWILLYPGVFWFIGMVNNPSLILSNKLTNKQYIYYNSSYWLSLKKLWADFPAREMDGLTKWYYLVQFAFWLQQIVVVNIEERRKDYAQMFTHHVITCALIFTSYGYHQSKVGNLIMSLMDVVDIFLPLAKILKYLHFQTLCDATFGVFIITWFTTRHALFMSICWSIYAQVPRVMNYGCFRGSTTNLEGPLLVPNDWDHLIQPFYDPEGLICMNDNIRKAFLGMLLALQVVLLVWFGMILRVAYKVIKGGDADDVRSDDEEEESELEAEIDSIPEPAEKTQYIEVEEPIEEEVIAEDMQWKKSSKKRSSSVKRSRRGDSNAATTGMSLRTHSDRKELLGRIGCEHKSS